MASKARYLVILIFAVVVIGAMFFIYSTIDSPEKVVYFDGSPAWYERIYCFVGGGKLESLSEINPLKTDCLIPGNSLQKDCISEELFSCHYH